MFTRHTFAATVLCAGLAAGLPLTASAQDTDEPTPSAIQLYEQGLQQLEGGQTEAARETFRTVDPMQLPREQRLEMYRLMQELDEPVSSTTTSDDRADDAPPQPRYESDDPTLNRAREQIDQAMREIEAGQYNAAEARLRAVQGSEVELGWFDQQRIERQLSLIEQQRSEAAAPPVIGYDDTDTAPPVATRTETPAETRADADVLSQVRLARAQEEHTLGREAAEAGQYHLAMQHYEESLALDPDNAAVRSDMSAAIAMQEDAAQEPAEEPLEGEPEGVLEVYESNRDLRAQETEAKFNEFYNTAVNELNKKNYAAAGEAVLQARRELDRGQRFLTAERYEQLRAQAVELDNRIVDQQTVEEAQRREEIARGQQQEEERARKEADKEQFEQVQSLLHRALEFQRDMKYDEALQLVDQALFLDPNNLAAQALKDILEDTRVMVQYRNIERQRSLDIANQAVQTLEATIPFEDLITYPSDWPQLTERRLRGLDISGGESEANRRVALKLREPVPIEFEGHRLVNVIDYLRNTTGVNFFVNWPSLEAAGIDRDLPITLQLTNVPAEQALMLVLQQASAENEFDPVTYSIIDGVVTISTERDLNRTTETRVYDIRDLLVQVPNFTNAPEFNLEDVLSADVAGGGGGTSIFSEADEEDELPTREELVEQITTLIQTTVGRQEDWELIGGLDATSSLRELNGNLIVKSTPQNHRQIFGLLAQLRETRAIQISVEARFLLVEENFLEDVGVDLDVQINNVGGNFGPIKIAQDSFELAQALPSPLTPDRFQMQSPAGANPGIFVPGEGFIPRTNKSLNFGATYLDDVEVNLLIEATQASRRAITLTAPRVTFFNGQRAFVVVARQVSFISDLEPIPDAIGFDTTVSVVSAGVVLDVEGTISADRRYVTLTLRPSLANIIDIREVEQTGTLILDTAGDQQDVQTFTGVIELPEIELTTVSATVSVPDNGTLLLGGQRLVGESEIEAGVPVLSKIPFINRLFTNSSTAKDRRTLLILIRPTIIIQSEEEEMRYPGMLQDPTQYNVGNTF